MESKEPSAANPPKERREVRYIFRALVIAIVFSSVAPVFFPRNHVQPAAQLIVFLAALFFLIAYRRVWRKFGSPSSKPSALSVEFQKASDEGNDPTLAAVGPKR